jgi:hypothetical protein
MGSAGLSRNIPIVLTGSGIHSPEFQEFLSPLLRTVLEHVSSIRLLFKTSECSFEAMARMVGLQSYSEPDFQSLGYSGVRLGHAAQPELFKPKSFGQSFPKFSRRNKPDFQGALLPLPFLRPRPSIYQLWHQRAQVLQVDALYREIANHQSNVT